MTVNKLSKQKQRNIVTTNNCTDEFRQKDKMHMIKKNCNFQDSYDETKTVALQTPSELSLKANFRHEMKGLWTYEMICKEALKYSTRKQFQKESKNAYEAARKRSLLNDVCIHMTPLRTKWTNDMLREESIKYSSRKQFKKKCGAAYEYARRKGILDDLYNIHRDY